MSLTESILLWTNAVLVPLGPLGLFVVAFIESSFFPIPPDIILIGLVLLQPENWFILASIATIGSVVGAIFGHAIGAKGGRPILNKIAGKHRTEKVESYFTKYGDWTIAIAAFTPVPYKIFTIASGVFKYNWKRMALISIPARGARFFVLSAILAFYGEQILASLELFLGPISIVAICILVGGYFIYKKLTGVRGQSASSVS